MGKQSEEIEAEEAVLRFSVLGIWGFEEFGVWS